MLNKKPDQFNWVVWVAGAFMVLWGVATILPGSGVQHRLDASHGLDEAHFAASLRQASSRMSPLQIEAFDWAMSGLDGASFVGRYGVSPTVRQVVVGEVARHVDAKRARIAILEVKLKDKKHQVEKSELERRKMLEVLKTYAPVITRVGYADDLHEKNNARSRCKDGECSANLDDGDRLLVWYRLDTPPNIDLKILPCRVVYSVKNRMGAHFEDFNCLARERTPGGEFYAQLSRIKHADSAEVRVTLEAFYEEAQTQHPLKYWRGVNVFPELPPELVELRWAKTQMQLVLDYKSRM
jgi:hypothetical protein